MFKHLKEQCFEFSASKGQGSLCFLGFFELYMFSGWGSRRSGGCYALLCFSGIHVLFGGSRQGSVPLRVKIINNFD